MRACISRVSRCTRLTARLISRNGAALCIPAWRQRVSTKVSTPQKVAAYRLRLVQVACLTQLILDFCQLARLLVQPAGLRVVALR